MESKKPRLAATIPHVIDCEDGEPEFCAVRVKEPLSLTIDPGELVMLNRHVADELAEKGGGTIVKPVEPEAMELNSVTFDAEFFEWVRACAKDPEAFDTSDDDPSYARAKTIIAEEIRRAQGCAYY